MTGAVACPDLGAYPANALSVQQHLDSEWNVGDHARLLSSVLSASSYEAHVYDGRPSVAFPAEPPRYEGLGSRVSHRIVTTLQKPGPMTTFTVHCEYLSPSAP